MTCKSKGTVFSKQSDAAIEGVGFGWRFRVALIFPHHLQLLVDGMEDWTKVTPSNSATRKNALAHEQGEQPVTMVGLDRQVCGRAS